MSTLRVDNIRTDNIKNSSGNDSPIDVPGAAKAFVAFNGVGTVSIKSSFNVSSLTDNGTGDYTINFTNNLANSNYVILGRTNNESSNANNYVYGLASNNNAHFGGSYATTSSCRVGSTWVGYQASPGLIDHGRIMVAIFGT